MYSVMIAGNIDFCDKIRHCAVFLGSAVFTERRLWQEMWAVLERSRCDLLVYDVESSGDGGMELLRKCSESGCASSVIVVDDSLNFERARQAVLLNASDYLMAPLDEKTLGDSICRALDEIDKVKTSDSISAAKKSFAAAAAAGNDGQLKELLGGVDSLLPKKSGKSEAVSALLGIASYIREYCCDKYGWLEYFIGDFDIFRGSITGCTEKTRLARFEKYVLEIARVIKRLYLFGEKKPLIESTVCYILNHCDEKITQNDVASACFVNKSYLSHAFKLETGMSFVDYISLVKMTRAKKLIAENDLMIFEVAKRIGFDDADYFCRKFKSVTGTTPKTYRETSRC